MTPMASQPIIELIDLHRRLDGQPVLSGVTAQLESGTVVALLGKNGAGKTTLLETALGFGFPDSGQALVWGAPAVSMTAATKRRIGFVPQVDELLPRLSATGHLILQRKLRSHWDQALVERLCREWEIPMDRATGKMSVGQRQKLAIVLAMAHQPELLVLDEPVAALDPLARRQFLQELVNIAADEHRAIVFSSHIVSDMERIASHVWMLGQGSLAWCGDLDRLKDSVVRLSIDADEPLPSDLSLPHTLAGEVRGRQAWLVVSHWQDDKLPTLSEQLRARIRVDHLGLEDIFLHMNGSQKSGEAA